MQSMEWTDQATSGRGRGVGKAISAYPLAANLDAKTLANLSQEQIHEKIQANEIQIGRVNSQGNITSIIYQGRRIRLDTVRRLAATSGGGLSSRVRSKTPENPGGLASVDPDRSLSRTPAGFSRSLRKVPSVAKVRRRVVSPLERKVGGNMLDGTLGGATPRPCISERIDIERPQHPDPTRDGGGFTR